MAMNKWIPETDPMILRRVGKTSEEAAELVKVCAATGVANREALTKEIADVMAQCDVCIDALDLDLDAIRRRVREKVEQMQEWEAMFSPHPA